MLDTYYLQDYLLQKSQNNLEGEVITGEAKVKNVLLIKIDLTHNDINGSFKIKKKEHFH